jgi:hypothetical protein
MGRRTVTALAVSSLLDIYCLLRGFRGGMISRQTHRRHGVECIDTLGHLRRFFLSRYKGGIVESIFSTYSPSIPHPHEIVKLSNKSKKCVNSAHKKGRTGEKIQAFFRQFYLFYDRKILLVKRPEQACALKQPVPSRRSPHLLLLD